MKPFIKLPLVNPKNAIIVYGGEYGMRLLDGKAGFHPGNDFNFIFESEVINPVIVENVTGKVIVYNTGFHELAGNFIGIVCTYLGTDYMITMQHFAEVNVSKNEELKSSNQKIGIIGNTGKIQKGKNVCMQIAKKTSHGWEAVPLFKNALHRPHEKDNRIIEASRNKKGEFTYNFLVE